MGRTVDHVKLAEWQRRFARQLASGLTVAEFCKGEGLTVGRWNYWYRRVERLNLREPRRASTHAAFQPVEIIPRRAVLVRFPGGTTLEIPDDRIDLVRLAIDRMAVLPEGDAC